MTGKNEGTYHKDVVRNFKLLIVCTRVSLTLTTLAAHDLVLKVDIGREGFKVVDELVRASNRLDD